MTEYLQQRHTSLWQAINLTPGFLLGRLFFTLKLIDMNKQQLLIPRVLCIGTKDGEPNDTSGDFITGDILTQTVKSVHKWKSEKLKHSVYLDPDFIAKFPHLFRRLAWCDYRDDKIGVDYVRYIKTGTVLPATHSVYNGKMFFIGPSKKYEPGIRFEPADESDYQEYQKQKQ